MFITSVVERDNYFKMKSLITIPSLINACIVSFIAKNNFLVLLAYLRYYVSYVY